MHRHKQTFAPQKGMSALPRKRPAQNLRAGWLTPSPDAVSTPKAGEYRLVFLSWGQKLGPSLAHCQNAFQTIGSAKLLLGRNRRHVRSCRFRCLCVSVRLPIGFVLLLRFVLLRRLLAFDLSLFGL